MIAFCFNYNKSVLNDSLLHFFIFYYLIGILLDTYDPSSASAFWMFISGTAKCFVIEEERLRMGSSPSAPPTLSVFSAFELSKLIVLVLFISFIELLPVMRRSALPAELRSGRKAPVSKELLRTLWRALVLPSSACSACRLVSFFSFFWEP